MESMTNCRTMTAQGGNFAGMSAKAVAQSGPTLIGETTEEVRHAAKRVYLAAAALREFNDGINGTQPRPGDDTSNKLNASSPTRAEQVRIEVRSLNSALCDLENEITRLQSI